MLLCDISQEAKDAIFKITKRREELLNSPHLTKTAKDWHDKIFFLLDNQGLKYCKKPFKIIGLWGEYERMCTNEGMTYGIGRWIYIGDDDWWKGLEYYGMFKNDFQDGFSSYILPKSK